MNFQTQTVLSKGPFFFTFRYAGRKIVAIFIHSNHYKSVSLQRTCTVVRSQDIYCIYYELAENAVEVDNTHGWGACVGCLEAQVDTASWYIEKARTHAHTHTHTHIHTNCPDFFTSHTVVFWGVCHSSNTHRESLQRHRNHKHVRILLWPYWRYVQTHNSCRTLLLYIWNFLGFL
jgi:hypothetical protein